LIKEEFNNSQDDFPMPTYGGRGLQVLPPDAFLPLRKSEYVNRGFKPTQEVEEVSKN